MAPMKSGLFTIGKGLASDPNAQAAVMKMVDVSKIDVKAIEEHVRGFAESSKVLMNALDDVAKIHPFIAVVRPSG